MAQAERQGGVTRRDVVAVGATFLGWAAVETAFPGSTATALAAIKNFLPHTDNPLFQEPERFANSLGDYVANTSRIARSNNHEGRFIASFSTSHSPLFAGQQERPYTLFEVDDLSEGDAANLSNFFDFHPNQIRAAVEEKAQELGRTVEDLATDPNIIGAILVGTVASKTPGVDTHVGKTATRRDFTEVLRQNPALFAAAGLASLALTGVGLGIYALYTDWRRRQSLAGISSPTQAAFTQFATATPTSAEAARVFTPTGEATSTTVSTAVPTITAKPSETPTATPTPEVKPLSLNSVTELKKYKIDASLFNRNQVFYKDGDRYIGNNGGNWGQNTEIERISSFPGFEGPVIHVTANQRQPKEGMQRPYITYEEVNQNEGEYAYEAFYLIKQAPKNLRDSGWHGDPIVVLQGLLTHVNSSNDGKYRLYGGVRLYYDSSVNRYYTRVYTGLKPGSGPTISDISGNRVEFRIGVKHGVRTELFYNNGIPSIRAFLITFDADGDKQYILIGQGPITDVDLKAIPIRGTIVMEGVYPSNTVNGLEAYVGEGKVYR